MFSRAIYTDRNLEIIRNLREDGKLSLWLFFCTAKENNKSSHFTREQFNDIGYSKSTVRLRLRQLKENDWCFVTKNGKIVLKSYTEIAGWYDVSLRKTQRIKYYGDSLKEVVARAAGKYTINNIHKQQKHLLKGEKERYKTTFSQCYTEGVCLSVCWLQEVLGFKTKKSGTNYFKFMQYKLNLIERGEQKQEFLGHVKNIGVECMKELDNVYLSKKGGVYKCSCKLIRTVK